MPTYERVSERKLRRTVMPAQVRFPLPVLRKDALHDSKKESLGSKESLLRLQKSMEFMLILVMLGVRKSKLSEMLNYRNTLYTQKCTLWKACIMNLMSKPENIA